MAFVGVERERGGRLRSPRAPIVSVTCSSDLLRRGQKNERHGAAGGHPLSRSRSWRLGSGLSSLKVQSELQICPLVHISQVKPGACRPGVRCNAKEKTRLAARILSSLIQAASTLGAMQTFLFGCITCVLARVLVWVREEHPGAGKRAERQMQGRDLNQRGDGGERGEPEV